MMRPGPAMTVERRGLADAVAPPVHQAPHVRFKRIRDAAQSYPTIAQKRSIS
jgi:hypothetical protein